jgi:hypothetical protein
MRSLFFRDVRQRRLVVGYRRPEMSVTNYHSTPRNIAEE